MADACINSGIDTDLFELVQLGPYRLANRIVMAPLTRSRTSKTGVPTPLMAEYYAQRASAGLIVAERTNVSAQGRRYALTPTADESFHSSGMSDAYRIRLCSAEERCP
jgi:N-ethylmaleimide reductase